MLVVVFFRRNMILRNHYIHYIWYNQTESNTLLNSRIHTEASRFPLKSSQRQILLSALLRFHYVCSSALSQIDWTFVAIAEEGNLLDRHNADPCPSITIVGELELQCTARYLKSLRNHKNISIQLCVTGFS
jgi:hypothetical protein